MNGRQWIQALLLSTTVPMLGAPTFAGSRVESANQVAAADGVGAGPGRPLIVGGLKPRTRILLLVAFNRARQRARGADCQSLFHDLDSEPHAALSRALYTEPRFPSEEAICHRRRAAAYTSVGPGVTVICPRFEHLGTNVAAAILLHEALHNAGQTEWPSDPEAPTSAQIQARVQMQCRL